MRLLISTLIAVSLISTPVRAAAETNFSAASTSESAIDSFDLQTVPPVTDPAAGEERKVDYSVAPKKKHGTAKKVAIGVGATLLIAAIGSFVFVRAKCGSNYQDCSE